jgi:hypothetical protein
MVSSFKPKKEYLWVYILGSFSREAGKGMRFVAQAHQYGSERQMRQCIKLIKAGLLTAPFRCLWLWASLGHHTSPSCTLPASMQSMAAQEADYLLFTSDKKSFQYVTIKSF